MLRRRRYVLFWGSCKACSGVFGVRLPRRISAVRLVRALTVAHGVAKPFCTGGTLEIPMVTQRHRAFTTHRHTRVRPMRRKGRR